MPIKQNSLSLSKNGASANMNMADGVLKKDRFAVFPEVLLSAPLIVKLVSETLFENSHFDMSGISLADCTLRTNNIHIHSSL